MHNTIAFLSKGKGLPAWFKDEWVMLGIGLHDLCKSVDYMCYKCEQAYGKEASKDVRSLRDQVVEKVIEFNRLESIAYHCIKEKRELNEDEQAFIKSYLEKNKDSIPEVLDPEISLSIPFPKN